LKLKLSGLKSGWLAFLIILLYCIPLYADAGTLFIWASFFHLIFGNFLIAFVEAYILIKIFHIDKKKHVFLIMLGANYFSFIAGYFTLFYIFKNFFSLVKYPLYFYYFYIILLWICAFILTVLFEWPFISIFFKRIKKRFKISLKASFFVQSVSYILIFSYYFFVVFVSGMRIWKIEPPENFISSSNILVYYIAPEDGNIFQIKLNGKGKKLFIKTHINVPYARLFTKRGKSNYELWIYKNGEKHLLVKNFSKTASFLKSDMKKPVDTSWNFGEPAYLIPEDKVKWEIFTDYWQDYGISIENGQSVHIAFPDPFHNNWAIRNVIVVSENLIIFQSFDQIIVADLEKKKMGVITSGRGPVVTYSPSLTSTSGSFER